MRKIALAASTAVAVALFASQASAGQQGPKIHPNNQHYAAPNPSAATGRSGTASLTVRALLNQNHSVDLEMSTGTLDTTATPPGSIAKAQVKITPPDGESQTQNHNTTSGGYRLYNLNGVPNNSSVQVQANIRGIDGRRTDVVTTTTSVKLRPDVAVSKVNATEQSKKNVPVQISALLAELNNDVDATVDCVLLVDGQEVDRADGIWIAAGDTVSCAFAYAFPADGTYNISVQAADVTPGDYDLTNNSASTPITIRSGFRSIQAGVWKRDYRYDYNYYRYYYYYDYWYVSYYNRSHTYSERRLDDSIWASAYADTNVAIPFSEISARLSADGNLLATLSFTNVSLDWTSGGYGCAYRSFTDANGRNHSLNACSTLGPGWSQVYYNSWGGTATYYSQGWEYWYWYSYWYGYGNSGYYSYNYSWTDGRNPASLLPAASVYNVSLTLDSMTADIDVVPQPSGQWQNSGSWWWGWYYDYYYESWYQREDWVNGSSYKENP